MFNYIVVMNRKFNLPEMNYIGRSRLNGKNVYELLLDQRQDWLSLKFTKDEVITSDIDMHICPGDWKNSKNLYNNWK